MSNIEDRDLSFSLISSTARKLWKNSKPPKGSEFTFRSKIICDSDDETIEQVMLQVEDDNRIHDPIQDLVKRKYFAVGKLIESELLTDQNIYLYDNLKSKASKQAVLDMIKEAGFRGIVISKTNYDKTKEMMNEAIKRHSIIYFDERTAIGELKTNPDFIKDVRLVAEFDDEVRWKCFADVIHNQTKHATIIDVKSYSNYKSVSVKAKLIRSGYVHQLCFMSIIMSKVLNKKINNDGYILAVDTDNGTIKSWRFELDGYMEQTKEIALKISRVMMSMRSRRKKSTKFKAK